MNLSLLFRVAPQVGGLRCVKALGPKAPGGRSWIRGWDIQNQTGLVLGVNHCRFKPFFWGLLHSEREEQ